MIPMGMQIIENAMIPEFVQVPVKKHVAQGWMIGRKYHERIQKKWNKRYGFTNERQILSDGIRLFMHPNTAAQIKALAKAH